jgi:hypothetical protein
VCFGALAVLAERLWIMPTLPLWLDETWSAMIASQPDWRSFWREAWLDCNPPLYYLLLKTWTSVFGDSNFALRLPSLILTTGAAVAALRWSPKSLGVIGRWTWAALILFWVQAFTVSVDARGYGLLLLLSTLGCIVFAKLYDQMTLRRAALWVLICNLMFLTHYYAAMLIAAQGLLLVHRHQLQLLRVWPVGALGTPALGWFVYQLPRLQEYARPDVAWYETLDLESAVGLTRYVFGHPAPTFVPLVVLIVIVGLALKGEKGAAEAGGSSGSPAIDKGLWAVAISGVLALTFALILGAVRPSLTARYLVPSVPPVMLGLVLIGLQSKRRELICTVLASVFLITSLNFFALREAAESRHSYGYEKGSAFLAEYRPTHLVFAWDHPAAKILDTASLAQIGRFFLHRSGLEFETTALVLREFDNPNVALAQAADGERPAIIWLYNTRRKSAARHFPPMFERNPAWACRHYRQAEIGVGVIACVKIGNDYA